ncbi:MAG: 2-iminoacetate synthase ThiH [Clostridiales Family XIII bacterium]|jgi:2-iminoacetate synthase|nr:2-iminoacetate synthase ThiH [Clostridiales Family XIII bacterium]
MQTESITREHDIWEYTPDMDIIETSVLDQVLESKQAYNPDDYTDADIKSVLNKTILSPNDLGALLSPAATPYLETLAQRALQETKKHFGNTRYLFTPLYIANHCDNSCIYCGFNKENDIITRAKLDLDAVERELISISKSGLQEILMLTGESPEYSPIEYIGEAVKLAKKHFNIVGLEIYPANVADYTYLRDCGADFVTVFQETYNPEIYERFHIGGKKRIFPYRFAAQERALKGGMRGVAFASLLGLDHHRKDAYATALHAYLLQRKYPHAEISFSVPRIRPIKGSLDGDFYEVSERDLLQIICAFRIFMPFAGITISSRENKIFRDNVLKIAATKVSAGVDTGIGAHSGESVGDEQFEIDDNRSVSQMKDYLKSAGLEPVMSDYIDAR